MTLAVMSRATLGHTGRALTASATTSVSYFALVLAAVIRPFAEILPEHYHSILALSGAGWLLAFGLFTVEYGRMLVAPRVVGLGMSPGPQKGLLRSVLRSPGLAQDGQCESVHAPLEPPDERGSGLGIARGETCQQCFVRGFHIPYYGSKPAWGLHPLRQSLEPSAP